MFKLAREFREFRGRFFKKREEKIDVCFVLTILGYMGRWGRGGPLTLRNVRRHS